MLLGSSYVIIRLQLGIKQQLHYYIIRQLLNKEIN
jgi:hypothetical protein